MIDFRKGDVVLYNGRQHYVGKADILLWIDTNPECKVNWGARRTECTLLRRPLQIGDRLRHFDDGDCYTVEQISPVVKVSYDGVLQSAVLGSFESPWSHWKHETGVEIDLPRTPHSIPPKNVEFELSKGTLARALFETDPRVAKIVSRYSEPNGPASAIIVGRAWNHEVAIRRECEVRAVAMLRHLK